MSEDLGDGAGQAGAIGERTEHARLMREIPTVDRATRDLRHRGQGAVFQGPHMDPVVSGPRCDERAVEAAHKREQLTLAAHV
jgi:hypothetical protein